MRTLSDYTEQEFLEFIINKFFKARKGTEEEDIQNIFEFERLTEHPDGSDLIFYPRAGREDSPEAVVQEVKEWRKANGMTGFKGS